MKNPKIKAIFFDFMGTCLDWHTPATTALPSSIPAPDRSSLALEWRHDYFDANAARLAANNPPEPFDFTLRKTLDALLEKHPQHKPFFSSSDDDDGSSTKDRCVAAWHTMRAWPDVPPALAQLKEAGYEVYVFANGTTRLQLDLCASSGLDFDMLFSSELLGVYKPALASYRKTLALVDVKPEESIMVAAHVADTRGGRAAGMRTVYVRRWSDDVHEDMEGVKGECDGFLEDMVGLGEVVGRL